MPLNDGAALVDASVLLRPVGDQSVVIHFLDPFVDDRTRPLISHVCEYCRLICEIPWWLGIALDLGQQHVQGI